MLLLRDWFAALRGMYPCATSRSSSIPLYPHKSPPCVEQRPISSSHHKSSTLHTLALAPEFIIARSAIRTKDRGRGWLIISPKRQVAVLHNILEPCRRDSPGCARWTSAGSCRVPNSACRKIILFPVPKVQTRNGVLSPTSDEARPTRLRSGERFGRSPS